MEDAQERYTIGALARLAGVTPRTIRYYTSEGLLPPPEARGRYASYGGEHLRLLEQIAQLKARYLPLSVIRERLAGEVPGAAPAPSKPAQTGGAERGWAPPGAVGLGPRLAEGPAPYSAGTRLSAGEGAPRPEEPADPFRIAPAVPLGRVEFFPSHGEEAGEGEDAPRREGGQEAELWRHLAVVPGVEVRVREPVSGRRRRLIDEFVAALRDRLAADGEA